jgi:NAD(P)H-dependent FMN reductase
MKILVLNGSPRKHGVVAALLKCAADGAAERGHEIEWIDVCDLSMRPCAGCMKCRSTGVCCLPEDDAHRVGVKIREAGGLIVGTPTYWSGMSAPLKLLFDRNVPVFIGEPTVGFPPPRQKGKPAAAVTACTTPWPWNFLLFQSRGALRAVRQVFSFGGYRYLGAVVKSGTKKHPEISERLRRRATTLGRRF